MAVYIPITLVEHTGDTVTYAYTQPIRTPDPARPTRWVVAGERVGRVRLDKRTGVVSQVARGDWDLEQKIFNALR